MIYTLCPEKLMEMLKNHTMLKKVRKKFLDPSLYPKVEWAFLWSRATLHPRFANISGHLSDAFIQSDSQ